MRTTKQVALLSLFIMMICPIHLLAQDQFIHRNDLNALKGITSKAKVGLNNIRLNTPTAAQLNNMKVLIAPGVVYDAKKYILSTRFEERADLKSIFDKKFKQQHLNSKPVYQETVEAKNNELTVVRTLTLNVKNPCATAVKKVVNVCFEQRGKVISKPVKQDLRQIRVKIKQGKGLPKKDLQLQRRLLAMNDVELLDYLLNKQSSSKTITHRSVLPMIAYQYNYNISNNQANRLKKPIASASELRASVSQLKKAPNAFLPSSLSNTIPTQTNNNPKRIPSGEPLTWDHERQFSQKFLTGFTFGREFGDTYRVQFAPETWLSDEYYAKFTYHISAGFGLRFPFEVTGSSKVTDVYSGPNDISIKYPAHQLCSAAKGNTAIAYYCAKAAQVDLKVTPIRANKNDYKRLGVDDSQLFNGKELVFEIGLTCDLYASIPGPDFSRNCPSSLKGIDFGRNFVPQIGAKAKTLFKKTIPGRPLGIALESGIGYAALNPGVALQAIDGRLEFDVKPYRSRVSVSDVKLTDRNTRFKVTENVSLGRAASFGFDLVKPNYRVNTRLVPLLEVQIGIDLGVLGWDHRYGPYELDDLAIELAEFNFSAHAGSPKKLHVPKVASRSNPR